MPLNRQEKEQFIAQYQERLEKSQVVIVLRNSGLTVSEITDFRRKLRDVGGIFQITKNTLLKIALRDSQFPVAEELFSGTVGVCFLTGSVAPSAKVVIDFLKDQKKLELLGALMPGEVFDASEAAKLVDLPTREQLLAQLVGTIQGPMTNVVGVVQAPLRELITVLHARSQQAQEDAA